MRFLTLRPLFEYSTGPGWAWTFWEEWERRNMVNFVLMDPLCSIDDIYIYNICIRTRAPQNNEKKQRFSHTHTKPCFCQIFYGLWGPWYMSGQKQALSASGLVD